MASETSSRKEVAAGKGADVKKVEWSFELDGEPHVVTLEHGFWTTRRVLRVDGRTRLDEVTHDNLGHEYRFRLGEHDCVVHVGLTYLPGPVWYALTVDGEDVPVEVGEARPLAHWWR